MDNTNKRCFGEDKQVVMTLDAGGTNFVFSAIQGCREIITPISVPAPAKSLEMILKNILRGFEEVRKRIDQKPVAISFAFPGPADYPRGIIGDLQNLPLFRGGVALGPLLEHHFGIPAFINNDGDLFALGEATEGMLPHVNRELKRVGSKRQYNNLLGVTFGTGFGGGIVIKGHLLAGDNAAAGEINRIRHRFFKQFDAEEGVSIRGIMHEYALNAGINLKSCPTPKEIFEIGMGKRKGNQDAAIQAYDNFGKAAGDAIANALTLVDGLVVIGGGISAAYPLFLPSLIREMQTPFNTVSGIPLDRLEIAVFNLEDELGRKQFYSDNPVEIAVPFHPAAVSYLPEKKTGVGITKLGTSSATSVGAYVFALQSLKE